MNQSLTSAHPLNSRHFSLRETRPDADIGEPVVALTLRNITFPHYPLILTRRELVDLRHLLHRWEIEQCQLSTQTGGNNV